MSAVASARQALARFRRGSTSSLDAADELLARQATHEARAFCLAFRATRTLSGLSSQALPPLAEAQGLLEASLSTSEGVAELCRVMSRASLLAFDLKGMSEWHELHSSLVSNSSDTYEWYGTTALWLDLMQGRPTVAEEAKMHLAELASDAPTELRVELLTLCALGALLLNTPESALPLSCQARVLAETENLGEWRWLTTLAHCRILRYLGRPHQASLLLRRLSLQAPPVFLPWIAWESTLASGDVALEGLDRAPDSAQRGVSADGQRAWRAVYELRDLVDAAKSVPSRVKNARDLLAATLNGVRPMLYEVQLIAGSLDYDQPPPKQLRSWCWGQEPLLPAGLHGLMGPPQHPPQATSLVVLRRGHVGRRVLALALPSLQAVFKDGWVKLEGQPLPRNGLAALALADHAELTHAQLFRHTYGIEYIRRLHQSLLNTLLERMTDLLGSSGTLTLRAHAVTLTLHAQALLIADARTVPPYPESVLLALEELGSATPEQVSELLGMPARLVRHALDQLVADGILTAESERDQARYALHGDLNPRYASPQPRPKQLSSEPPSRRTGT